MKRAALAGCCILVFSAAALPPQTANAGETDKGYLQATPEQMQWWRDARFGLFVHWGPVSLKGTEIGWSRGGERRGRSGKGNIPVEEYDNLYQRFNPSKFNAKEWAEIAKAAGMKYLVFTSKHHDGFSMFDSRLTDYKITNSPFKRDVCAELAKAFREAGLKVGWYYSPVDWWHKDYRTDTHEKYIEYMHGQLRELCTNYGKIDIIWFDGLGGSAQDWNSEPLFKMIRELQPGILINNRAGLPADFDTPEQRVGRFQTDRAWESCITICRQWAWKPDDQMKSLEQCIHTLVRCAGGDGNLLFNVGPMPDGRIEPRQVERLKEMGDWLKKNGESIYGTRGGPFRPHSWGASTHKGNTIYLHVLQWGENSIRLPAIKKRVVRSTVLGGGGAVVRQSEESIDVSVPPQYRNPLDTVVVLHLDGPAAEADPVELASGSVARGKEAKASNVFQQMAAYGPDKALDDDETTRWATDAGTQQAWLEVDLGMPGLTQFDRVRISEAFDRVRKFEIQIRRGEGWETVASGAKIGEERILKFKPVEARHVRLNILEATEGPTIWEFQLFAPTEQ